MNKAKIHIFTLFIMPDFGLTYIKY